MSRAASYRGVEFCLGDPQPSPAAAEFVLTINGEEIPIVTGTVAFGFGEGQRVVEPSEEFRERFRMIYEDLWRRQLGFPFGTPPAPMSDPGASPIPDDLRERLANYFAEQAIKGVEAADGFFDVEDEDR